MAAVIIAPGDARRYAKHLSAPGIPPRVPTTRTASALRSHGLLRIADYPLAGHQAQFIHCHPSGSYMRLSTHPRNRRRRPRGML